MSTARHDSQLVRSAMEQRFPEWDKWEYIVRGFYYFQQCATINIIDDVAKFETKEEWGRLIDEFAKEFNPAYLQRDSFLERPFSQLKVYVWHMAALQLMADYNMCCYHQTPQAQEIGDIESVANFSIGAMMMDTHDLVETLISIADDQKSMDAQFHVDIATRTAMLMEAGSMPYNKPLADELREEDRDAMPKPVEEMDAYQMARVLLQGDGDIHDPLIIPSFAHIYLTAAYRDVPFDITDYLALRLKQAGTYLDEHTKYLDNDGSHPWDGHALWKMFSQEVRNTTWPTDKESRDTVASMFRHYAREEERPWVASADDNGIIDTLDGTVHPMHMNNDRALQNFAHLQTPADMTRIIYPRLPDYSQH